MKRYEIMIPPSTIGQLRKSDFQWTFTIFEDVEYRCRAQYTSRELYKKFKGISVGGVLYDLLIFDFKEGVLIFETRETMKHKVFNILKFLTIHTSPSSRTYFINSKKSDGVK
ncbi:Phage protein OS=Ureibacillus acetophenoni OX=614649 GN=SAMN05877842_10199 PE=4 SV=1 [Ureibacillus acetophenoni]